MMESLNAPSSTTTENSLLTPEQIKRIELNRLKAKARQRQREQEAGPSSAPNSNQKRPLEVIPAVSTSPTAPKPLRRDSRLGKYFDYDLSKMVNSKGGFLVEDGKEVDEDSRVKERERERQRAKQNLEPPMYLDPSLNPKCRECQSIDIDYTYKKIFGCLVCNKCKDEYPEKYGLLTKTECKEDYLLTDPELRDRELLPHLLKANPHKSTFANMMLFLRCQVEDFAWKKWGSPEALDTEWERRTEEKKKKKNKKFEEGLRDLRRRTREGVWQRRKDQEHKHAFGVMENLGDGMGRQSHEVAVLQPMDDPNQAESSKISTSLELEQIEVNLFRSKTLYRPTRARGVFGGQVISQAIVAATNCVDPVFGLHSLHCYFLLSASPAIPIIYFVERLREGRSYTTRSVKAVQNGKVIFQLMCSYHKPEPWQPTHQWPMPEVPPLEECELDEVLFRRRATMEDLPSTIRDVLLSYALERENGPISVRRAGLTTEDGTQTSMHWMQARTGQASHYGAPYQKCILAYLSDLNFITAASDALKLKRMSNGPDAHAMTSSLDHSIWYYDDNFCCEDGLLYVVICPRAASGRAVVHGRLYSRTGNLVAVTCQEGVVRANVRGPTKNKANL
ncbi:thioesterase-like superfamily-domain-containing protein [Suillus occidentalis]|nr:thioesterase-like superfamily-domain-containing protein [Suillus occidentalis]